MKNKWRRSRLILTTRSEIAFHLALVLVAMSAHAAEVIPPKPAAYFNDYAGVVSKEAASRFNEQLAQFERDTSNQVVVAVFPKMQSDDDVAAYTRRIAEKWDIGQKGTQNGTALFVFTQDRKMFIQTAHGVEGALPDITCFDITEYKIKPHFRAGDYEAGLAEGIDSILKAIRGEYKGTGKTVRERGLPEKVGLFVLNHFVLLFIILLFFLPRLKPRKGYHYSSGGGGWAWSYGGGGGGWSSGGGGGGFSGFSGGGGGGGFGGGGAGSSW